MSGWHRRQTPPRRDARPADFPWPRALRLPRPQYHTRDRSPGLSAGGEPWRRRARLGGGTRSARCSRSRPTARSRGGRRQLRGSGTAARRHGRSCRRPRRSVRARVGESPGDEGARRCAEGALTKAICGDEDDRADHEHRQGAKIVKDTRRRRRSEEHTSELQSRRDLVCRLLLEKKKKKNKTTHMIKNKNRKVNNFEI